MKLNFKKFMEGGQGSGTKFSGTGSNAGGQAQAGMGMTKPAKPVTAPPSDFNPADSYPPGYKPTPGPGAMNYKAPVENRKPGLMGAGEKPPYQPIGKPTGGSIGGGSPQAKMKAKMKSKMKK